MGSELSCISSCVIGQNPIITGINFFLIIIIAVASILLIFFQRKLSVKASLFLKSLLIISIFSLLLVLTYNSTHLTQFSLFHWTHETALALIVIFFITSYFTSSFIVKIGLKKANIDEKILIEFIDSESKNLNVKKPSLFVFEDANPGVFIVSGFNKQLFVSTGALERLDDGEKKLMIVHELMHLKTNFFNIKRFFYSIKAGFLGLLPLTFDELEEFEERMLDNKMAMNGMSPTVLRKKLE